MPIPPPPPGGPPPAPTFSQVNTHGLPVSIVGNPQTYVNLNLQVTSSPGQLSQEVGKGRSALLSDICKGTSLKRVAVVNDRSAPLLSPTAKSPTPVADHPYIRLYQYLHQKQGAPSPEQKTPPAVEGKTGGVR